MYSKIIDCVIIDRDKYSRDRIESLLNMFNQIDVKLNTGTIINCVEEIKQIKPDLVFLDIEMPEKTGFDIIDELRTYGEAPEFIFVTNFSQYAQKAIKAEVFDYILKPIDIDELKESIARFTEKKSPPVENSIHITEYNFTPREEQIFGLVKTGKTSKQIAEVLSISRHTVDTHRRKINEKTVINQIQI